ncbi:MAG: hypothetical protein H6560_28860 [Lewinellaceae bacterium]|nr:hypothetical protein [Lewinellaceae bacterium]
MPPAPLLFTPSSWYCDELLTGKADMMLAGAVCASDQLFIHMGFSIFHAYAGADDKFVPLDKGSAGLVSSEGRHGSAQTAGGCRAGRRQYPGSHRWHRAVERRAGQVPAQPPPQRAAPRLRARLLWQRHTPEETSYLECHATGTPLGDLTEMNSIADFFAEHQAFTTAGLREINIPTCSPPPV